MKGGGHLIGGGLGHLGPRDPGSGTVAVAPGSGTVEGAPGRDGVPVSGREKGMAIVTGADQETDEATIDIQEETEVVPDLLDVTDQDPGKEIITKI